MFKLQYIKLILAPQYEEFTSDKMETKVKRFIDSFEGYFPSCGGSYIPQRKYFEISTQLLIKCF